MARREHTSTVSSPGRCVQALRSRGCVTCTQLCGSSWLATLLVRMRLSAAHRLDCRVSLTAEERHEQHGTHASASCTGDGARGYAR